MALLTKKCNGQFGGRIVLSTAGNRTPDLGLPGQRVNHLATALCLLFRTYFEHVNFKPQRKY